MAQIFISYNKRDRDLAERVAAALRREGLTAWWDEEVTPRENWDRTLEREIEQADKVLVLWTRNSVESDWVRIEANWARNCVPSKLVQARFDHCKIPIAFSMVQYVDLDWETFDGGGAWRKLLWFLVEDRTEVEPGSPEAEERARLRRAEIADERRRHLEQLAEEEEERAAGARRQAAAAAEERERVAAEEIEKRQRRVARRWKIVLIVVGIVFAGCLGVAIVEGVARARAPSASLRSDGELRGTGTQVSWYPESRRYVDHIYFNERDLLDDGCAEADVWWKPTPAVLNERMQLCLPADRLEAAREAQRRAVHPESASPGFLPWEVKFESESSF